MVDDDRLNRRILGGILETAGYAVHEATSGKEALTQYVAVQPHPVLLDVMMPGIDGFAVCRKMVEAYRGAIAAENLPGGGCEFSVVVPALG